jgi:two-component system, LuxR family, sensor kinase FixL
MELSSIYSKDNRKLFLTAAAILVAAIATIDWLTKPYVSLGFLYLFPILLIAGFLPRWQIASVAVVCAVLHELFSNLPPHQAMTRLAIVSAGFAGTGLFASEVVRNRQMAIEHLQELETQIRLRQETEEQLQLLVESSPLAIVTIDADGRILLANEASQNLLAPGDKPIVGRQVGDFLPALQSVVQTHTPKVFRTELRCRGKRLDGEAFLAAVWFSTYNTLRGPRLAAIIVDLSEDLRDREDLSLDHLLKNTKILMSAVAHEIRNLCGAVQIVYKNLSRVPSLEDNEDFRVLGTLMELLEKLSEMELRPSGEQLPVPLELSSVLDELRVLIEPSYREAGIEIVWRLQDDLPLVTMDRYGLQQVFLNLARNSQRAMQTTAEKKLTISTSVESNSVLIRFEDTGVGISAPNGLFKAFQEGAEVTGLGLYVSRAILRSCGGEIAFEPAPKGCCFAVSLPIVPAEQYARQ